MKKMKDKVYEVIEVAPEGQRDLSWLFDLVLMSLIILNVLAIILESVPSIKASYKLPLYYFEVFSVVFFSIEYLLRVWSITSSEEYRHPLTGRIRFIFSPMALIDLMAILPFFVKFLGVDMRVIRIFRMFRIFRLFKLVRYAKALNIISNVFKNKREELVISLFFILFMLLVVSSVMYYVENSAQPEQFSSIPSTMWWGVATLTTVGYGDIYPVTEIGKFLAGIIAILGIGLFALPTGILAAGCAEEIERVKKQEDTEVCPCCGRQMTE